MTFALVCKAQDYDDENYGNQGGQGGGGGGGSNQGDGDNYQNGYEDGYNANQPNNYQQNVDSDGSNNNPSSYSPQGGSDADGDYEGDDSSAAASAPEPSVIRVRRSVDPTQAAESAAPKLRVKRHGKYYIGPVYTYVKTDKHANFKWGVSTLFECCLPPMRLLLLLLLTSKRKLMQLTNFSPTL